MKNKKLSLFLCCVLVSMGSLLGSIVPVGSSAATSSVVLPACLRSFVAQWRPGRVVGNYQSMMPDTSNIRRFKLADQPRMGFEVQKRYCTANHEPRPSVQQEDQGQGWKGYAIAFGLGAATGIAYSYDKKKDVQQRVKNTDKEDVIFALLHEYKERKDNSIDLMRYLVSQFGIKAWDVQEVVKKFHGFNVSDEDLKNLIDLVCTSRSSWGFQIGSVAEDAAYAKQDQFLNWYLEQEKDTAKFAKDLLVVDKYDRKEVFDKQFQRVFGFNLHEAFEKQCAADLVELAKEHKVAVQFMLHKAIHNTTDPKSLHFIEYVFKRVKSGEHINVSKAFYKAIDEGNVPAVKLILNDTLVNEHGHELWRDAGRLDHVFQHAVEKQQGEIRDLMIEHFRRTGDWYWRFTEALRPAIDNNDYESVQKILAEKGAERYKVAEIYSYMGMRAAKTDPRITKALHDWLAQEDQKYKKKD